MGRANPKVKSFEIPKRLVFEAWKKVRANDGAPGVDRVSITEFESREGDSLYKLWNRMSAGSYMPSPVRAVEIPKDHGTGVRVLHGTRARMTGRASRSRRGPRRFSNASRALRTTRQCWTSVAAPGVSRRRCWHSCHEDACWPWTRPRTWWRSRAGGSATARRCGARTCSTSSWTSR